MATARQLLLLKRADLIEERNRLLATKAQAQAFTTSAIADINAKLAATEANIDGLVTVLDDRIADLNQAITGLP